MVIMMKNGDNDVSVEVRRCKVKTSFGISYHIHG